MPVLIGKAAYPTDILSELTAKDVLLDAIDALSLAEAAGSAKAVNIVLMGRLARYLGIAREKWEDAIRRGVKAAFVDVNLRAFSLGYENDAE